MILQGYNDDCTITMFRSYTRLVCSIATSRFKSHEPLNMDIVTVL